MTKPREALKRVKWPKTHRIVRAADDAVSLVDDIADPGDWVLLNSAALTTRLSTEHAKWQLDNMPAGRRVDFSKSDYTTIMGIMIPFLRCSQSRFSDGSYGVWYGCGDERTALAETVHHYRKFMQSTERTRTRASSSGYEELIVSLDRRLHDVNTLPKALHPSNYDFSRRAGARLRSANSNGVLWSSVRHPEGKCVGLFWPDVVGRPVKTGARYIYRWLASGAGEVIVRNRQTDEVLSVT